MASGSNSKLINEQDNYNLDSINNNNQPNQDFFPAELPSPGLQNMIIPGAISFSPAPSDPP